MKKFLLLYMSPVSPEEQMQNANPGEMNEGMDLWMKWFDTFKKEIVEQGQPTGSEMNVTKTGSSRPNTYIAGYSILQVDDTDAVKSILADHPHFMMEGNSIEVLELMPMPGM